MIEGMRKFARSRWALVVLFVPLVIALAVTLPDTFGGGMPTGTISQIGSREIRLQELDEEVRRTLNRIRIEEQRDITQADAVREGIVDRELMRLEYGDLVLGYADKIGIRASAETLKGFLERNRTLTDVFGKVDINSIRAEAQSRNLSPREYETFLLDFLTQRYVEMAALSSIDPPDVLSQPIINHFGETFTLSFARVGAATVPAPAEPTEAELQAWYDANTTRFNQPERRRISVLTYSPEDFLDKVELSQDKLREEYQKRIKDYSTPETREVVQFMSADRNQVQDFIDLVKQGRSMDEAFAQVPGLARSEQKVTPVEVENEDLRAFLFSVAVGDVNNAPAQLAEGQPYFAAMVKSVTPGVPTPFEQVVDKVRRDVALPEAQGLYEASTEAFNDAAGGQPLEDIGKQFGVPVFSLVAVDSRGVTAKGDQASLLTANPDALQALFTLEPGQMTQVFEGDYVRSMYRLDEIVAPSTLPFAEVKSDVRMLVMRERSLAAMDKAVNDAIAAAKSGTAFADAARAAKLEVMPPLTFMRAQPPQIDPALVEGALALKAGETALVRAGDGQPWAVRVDEVKPATPDVAAMIRMQVSGQVMQTVQNDFQEVFVRGLQREVPYERDQAAFERYRQSLLPQAGQ